MDDTTKARAERSRKVALVDKNCGHCGELFSVRLAKITHNENNGRFCSRACAHKFNAKVINDRSEQRFWSRVDKNGPLPTQASLGACWVWTGPLERNGYARLSVKNRNTSAHRYSFELTAQDSVKRGRHAHGERTPISKLTDDLVRQIRASTEGCWKAAERFGVTATTISDIRRRKTWKHVA